MELDVSSTVLSNVVETLLKTFFTNMCMPFSEKGKWPCKVQQQRREPSERGEAEIWPAQKFAQGEELQEQNCLCKMFLLAEKLFGNKTNELK